VPRIAGVDIRRERIGVLAAVYLRHRSHLARRVLKEAGIDVGAKARL